MTLFSIKRRGLMLVLSSPSGAGKTSIARELLAIDDNLEMSVSATTRPRRPGEVLFRRSVDRLCFDFVHHALAERSLRLVNTCPEHAPSCPPETMLLAVVMSS